MEERELRELCGIGVSEDGGEVVRQLAWMLL